MKRFGRVTLGLGVLTVVVLLLTSLVSAQVAGTPVPVQDVDNPAFQPYATECWGGSNNATGFVIPCFLGAVPAGKRLVIETVSGTLMMRPGTKPTSIKLLNSTSGRITNNYFPATFQNSVMNQSNIYIGDSFTVNQSVRLYVDAGYNPEVVISSGFINMESCDFTVSGYLVNVP